MSMMIFSSGKGSLNMPGSANGAKPLVISGLYELILTTGMSSDAWKGFRGDVGAVIRPLDHVSRETSSTEMDEKHSEV